MNPIIAIVGRPNVGKSTLFNRLTRSQQALVVDEPGVTRDRQYGRGVWQDLPYLVIDTGGLGDNPNGEIEQGIMQQSQAALLEANIIFFVVDARAGLTPIDRQIAKSLRKLSKPIVLVMNKMDGMDKEAAVSEFCSLGFADMIATTASHNRGTEALLEHTFEVFEHATQASSESQSSIPKVAIIGRPNVGKSTLVNRMMGEQRVIVCDHPGTTRDSIYVDLERMGRHYTLIDTAGVRKKKNVVDVVEKFSAIKTIQSVKDAHVVLLVFDARLGLTDQDLTLINLVMEEGRALIICANKWDGMTEEDKEQVKSQLSYRLRFADFAPVFYISALHGTGVGDLFKVIDAAFKSAMLTLNTTNLSAILEKAVATHEPPMIKGRRIKLRYAHCGGHNPPTIVIHGNQMEELPLSYQKYLSKFFIKALRLEATPVRIICKSGENPFAGKRNVLTKRQIHKRTRLMKYVKKQAKRKAKK